MQNWVVQLGGNQVIAANLQFAEFEKLSQKDYEFKSDWSIQ